MEYILGEKPGECIFCGMGSLEPARFAERHVLGVFPHAIVCLNRYPFAAGHVLVAPRRHVAELTDLSHDEYGSLMHVVREAVARLRRAVRPDGVNLGFNFGAAAGAGMPEHLHGHLVPRWQGDTHFMPVLADVRVMPQHLDDTWRHLWPHFVDLAP
jgi:ATP adenylyltransferase